MSVHFAHDILIVSGNRSVYDTVVQTDCNRRGLLPGAGVKVAAIAVFGVAVLRGDLENAQIGV